MTEILLTPGKSGIHVACLAMYKICTSDQPDFPFFTGKKNTDSIRYRKNTSLVDE